MAKEIPIPHDPNCDCEEHALRKRGKTTTTRREFLCLAVGAVGAAGVAGAVSTARAKSFIDLPDPSAKRIARTTKVDFTPPPKTPAGTFVKTDPSAAPITVVLPKCPDMHTHLR